MNKSNKIAAVLACRVFSTRLFCKPLQRVGKYTILELLIRQLKKSKMLNEIVLAISDDVGHDLFVDFAKRDKIKYVLGDEVDVLGRLIQGAKFVNANIILRTTSENPFIFWEGIDELIKEHIKGNFDLTTHYMLPLGSGLEVINLKALELSHKYGKKRHRTEYSDLFIWENPDRFKIHKLSVEKLLRRPKIRLTVDTPEDLLVARIIHDEIGRANKPIPLRKIIKFLDSHPRIKKINSNVPLKYTRRF